MTATLGCVGRRGFFTIFTSIFVFVSSLHLGGCQNYRPSLDPYYNTAPNI